MNSINDKLSSVIYPQLLQLVNVYSVKYIDTGDRVTDGICTAIFNAVIAIIASCSCTILSYIYKLWCRYNSVKILSNTKNNSMLIVENILPEYKIEQIIKCKYNIKTTEMSNGYYFSDISSWAVEKKKINSVQSSGKSTACAIKFPTEALHTDDKYKKLSAGEM